MLQEVKTLLYKEFILEWRQRTTLNAMLLYLGSTVMVCFLSLGVRSGALQPQLWNALLWIILLFGAVSAIAKSFMQEPDGRLLYLYTLASPQSIIIAKMAYNVVLMLLLSACSLLFYSIVLGNPVQDMAYFSLALALGAISFSATFTLLSAIAQKANNNGTLVPVLGFPIILPTLLMSIKLAKNAMDGLDRSQSSNELLTLVAIDAIIITVSLLLFPYVWRS
jgi:heme exporter protein B